MNAFARGNVASARRRLVSDLETLQKIRMRMPFDAPHLDALGWVCVSLEIAIEDLDNAVALDEMTEERKTG